VRERERARREREGGREGGRGERERECEIQMEDAVKASSWDKEREGERDKEIEREREREREREGEGEREKSCWARESFKRMHAEIGICEFVCYCILLRCGRLRVSVSPQSDKLSLNGENPIAYICGGSISRCIDKSV
jgi:hypothetical protein